MCDDGCGFEITATCDIDHNIHSDEYHTWVDYGSTISFGYGGKVGGVYLNYSRYNGLFTEKKTEYSGTYKPSDTEDEVQITSKYIYSGCWFCNRSIVRLCRDAPGLLGCCNDLAVQPAVWIVAHGGWAEYEDENPKDSDRSYTKPVFTRCRAELTIGENKTEILFSSGKNPNPDHYLHYFGSKVYRISLVDGSVHYVGETEHSGDYDGIVRDDISSYTKGLVEY